jgi:hypothetical protein
MHLCFPVSTSLILLLCEHSAATILPYEDPGTEPIAGGLFSDDRLNDKPVESTFDLSAGDPRDPSADIFADISHDAEFDLFAGVSSGCAFDDFVFDGTKSFGRVRARGQVCDVEKKTDVIKDSNSEIGRVTNPGAISKPTKPNYVGLFCSEEKSNGNDIPVCDSGIPRLNTRGVDGFYTLENSELCELTCPHELSRSEHDRRDAESD